MGGPELDLHKLQLIYRHTLSRSLVIKILLVSVAIAALPFLATLRQIEPSDDACDLPAHPAPSIPSPDLEAVLLDLMAERWLSPGGRALCVGSGRAAAAAMRRLGIIAAVGAEDACGGLPFRDAAFDFVFSAGLDRAGAPARAVLEMERVLRPGRAGAVVAGPGPARYGGLVRAAAPVAALLAVSDVVAVRRVNGSTPVAVVVFRKRAELRTVE